MAPIKPSLSPRVDTRGLPEGYDPHMFYEYRFQQLSANPASVLEGFIYQLIPYSLIRSFAIAIDPFHQFKVSPNAITPSNRKRYRMTVSVFDYSLIKNTSDISHRGSYVNWNNTNGANGPVHDDPPLHFEGVEPTFAPPSARYSEANDTTRRTRLIGSKDGTFDKFKPIASSPKRTVNRNEQQYLRYSGAPYGVNGSPGVYGFDNIYQTSWDYNSTVVPGAVYSNIDTDTLRFNELTIAETLMSKHASSMFRDILPTRKGYTLFRNLVELRDVPRGILQLQKTIQNLRALDASLKMPKSVRNKIRSFKTPLKDIPKEYLSYHFGWKQTYKDVMGLLEYPEKATKKFNFLLARNGKPTSYRSRREFLLGGDSVPSFYYPGLHWEEFPEQETHVSRTCELRMVVNSTFDFPPIDPTNFQRSEFIRRLGVVPSFTDFYNLVPWTWLLDWFTGFGNYIDIIEEVNNDKSLINYGFITCVSKGQVRTIRKWYDVRSRAVDLGTGWQYSTPWERRSHESSLDFNFQLRKDLSTVMDVKTTTDPATLSPYQLSILGALLSQRTNFKRT